MTIHQGFEVTAWIGWAVIVAVIVFFIGWFIRDKYVFGPSDQAELNRLMGAYDGSVPVEGATTPPTTHRKSRSPFARPRAARDEPPASVID